MYHIPFSVKTCTTRKQRNIQDIIDILYKNINDFQSLSKL